MPVALDCSRRENLIGWIHWMEDNRAQRVIAEDKIGPYWVSTIFLGRDQQQPSCQGPARLFETMIFERDESTCLLIDDTVELIAHAKSELHHLRWRYATWEAAGQGHRKVADMVSRSVHKGSQWWDFVAGLVKSKTGSR